MTHEEDGRPGVSSSLSAPSLTREEILRLVHGATPFAIVGLAILALFYTMYFAADLFLPVFFAIFLSIILRPLVGHMKRVGVPEPLGALVVLIAMVMFVMAAVSNLSGPADEWVRRLPDIQREIEVKLWPVTRSIEQAKEATENIRKLTDGRGAESQEVTVKGPTLLDQIFATTWLTFVQVSIIMALTFFLLSQNSERTQRTIRNIAWFKNHNNFLELLSNSREKINSYLRISAIIYISIGIFTALIMYLLDMPNPVLWGSLAAVLGFMPYIGPIIVFGCIGIVALLTFDQWWQILAPPFAYAMLSLTEGYFITPTILGRYLTLNPISVFLSMLLWTWVWGVPGALLSVPLLVVATIAVRHLATTLRVRPDEPV